jgi:predicted DNA-binding protein
MRTTIELRNDQQARLLELAAQRGEKGFSSLIREAVDRYLEDLTLGDRKIEEALEVLGTLPAPGADALRERVNLSRRRWR